MGHGFEIRKNFILDKLTKEGSLLVKDAAKELDISETTLRRDLNELHAQGLLKQVYGGAVRIEKEPTAGFKFSLSNRSSIEIDEKKRIGAAAATLVNDNDILYIDPGSTSWEMIPYLKSKRNLTIISNSVRLLQCLNFIGHHTIIQLGGTLRPERLDTVGSLAHMCVEQLRGFKAFQGGDGMDTDFGLSAIDQQSALIAKTVLSNAREIIILADHTKFENPSLLYKIIDINEIDYLITDRPLAPSWEKKCKDEKIQVMVA
jgi:DeoR family transcriptional regulator, fructose operon transcriptional repressor